MLHPPLTGEPVVPEFEVGVLAIAGDGPGVELGEVGIDLLQHGPLVPSIEAVVKVHHQVAVLQGVEGDVGQVVPGGVDNCFTAPLNPYPILQGFEVGCCLGCNLGG